MGRFAIHRDLLLAPILQHRGRLALSLLAIALGVALGYAVQLVNHAAINEFAAAVQTLFGEADLVVRGPRAGFDESLYPSLASLPEVAVASPVLELDARLPGRRDALKILGLDIFRAAQVQPFLAGGEIADRLDFLRPDRIFLSGAAAEWLGLKKGDALSIQVGLRVISLQVAGTLGDGRRQRFAVVDLGAAQAIFARPGVLNRIDLRLRPGADPQRLARRLGSELPPGTLIERPEADAERTGALSRAYRVNLNVLALVALFTGGLLVFSAQALAVVRRRSQLALLRALGMTRRALVAMLLAEAAVVGAVGALAGIALGHATAAIVLRRFGAELGAGYFRGLEPTLALDLPALALFFAAGVAGACGAACGRRPYPGGAGARPAVLWLRRDRASPDRNRDVDAAHRGAVLSRSAALGAAPGADRARAASGRSGTNRCESRRNRRSHEPHGVDGDHGHFVPSIAGRVAGARAARGPLLAHGRRLRHSVSFARGAAGARGAPGRAPGRVPAQPAAVHRSGQAADHAARPRRRGGRQGAAAPGSGVRPQAGRPARGLGERNRRQHIRLAAGRCHRASLGRAAGALYRLRRVARLRAPAGRGADRALRICAHHGRRERERRSSVARAGRGPGELVARDRGAHRGRREPRGRGAGRDPRALAQDLRPHLRRHLRARGGGGDHRPPRAVLGFRGARARAAARIRHAAPSRHDAQTDRRDARRAGAARQRDRSRRGPRARVSDQPGAYPRREPPVFPLGHGPAPALAASGGVRGGDARACDAHRGRERPAGDERGRGGCGQGRLVKS